MTLKIPSHVRFIAIEGVIGAGKTTLARHLTEMTQQKLILETFQENPFLEKFYRNNKQWAFQAQMWFLLSRYRQLHNEFQHADLFYQTIISDYTFDKDRIFASLNLNEDEMNIYDQVASALKKEIIKPDYIVYLQASVDTLTHRIKKRGREMEKDIDPRYLKNLIDLYDHHFYHYTDCPVLIINTDPIDFVKNERNLMDLLQKISDVPTGTSYYNPASFR